MARGEESKNLLGATGSFDRLGFICAINGRVFLDGRVVGIYLVECINEWRYNEGFG